MNSGANLQSVSYWSHRSHESYRSFELLIVR
jgi:hypothetical protein